MTTSENSASCAPGLGPAQHGQKLPELLTAAAAALEWAAEAIRDATYLAAGKVDHYRYIGALDDCERLSEQIRTLTGTERADTSDPAGPRHYRAPWKNACFQGK